MQGLAIPLLFKLQTDSTKYKYKWLILRHFRKLLNARIYMEKNKKCNKNAIEAHSDLTVNPYNLNIILKKAFRNERLFYVQSSERI